MWEMPHEAVNYRLLGAAWYRFMPAEERGYGFVDVSTSEIGIAIVPNHRGLCGGRAVLRRLLDIAESQGVDGRSLGVHRNNLAAVELYERSGFAKLFDIDSEVPSWVIKVDVIVHRNDRGAPLTEASATNEPRD